MMNTNIPYCACCYEEISYNKPLIGHTHNETPHVFCIPCHSQIGNSKKREFCILCSTTVPLFPSQIYQIDKVTKNISVMPFAIPPSYFRWQNFSSKTYQFVGSCIITTVAHMTMLSFCSREIDKLAFYSGCLLMGNLPLLAILCSSERETEENTKQLYRTIGINVGVILSSLLHSFLSDDGVFSQALIPTLAVAVGLACVMGVAHSSGTQEEQMRNALH